MLYKFAFTIKNNQKQQVNIWERVAVPLGINSNKCKPQRVKPHSETHNEAHTDKVSASCWFKCFTLTSRDSDSRYYNLLVIMTWNLCDKYSPLTAMLICPVITIFYMDFFSDYNLKMSKIGRWSTFPYLYQRVPNNNIMGTPLNTCSSAILFITSIIYYFRIQTIIPSYRGVLGITISNLEGNQAPHSWKMIFYTPPAVKLKLDKWSYRKIKTHISTIVKCFCLGSMLIPCHIIYFKPWFSPN